MHPVGHKCYQVYFVWHDDFIFIVGNVTLVIDYFIVGVVGS